MHMKILGIESSCDETAAAVVEDGKRLLSNVVHSQIDIHVAYGGVVPEVAARSHIEVINPVVQKALQDADCTWDDIDAIAVTYAPGLIGSLLVGTLTARTLAVVHDKPIYAIHHVEGHVYANFLVEQGLPSSPISRTASHRESSGASISNTGVTATTVASRDVVVDNIVESEQELPLPSSEIPSEFPRRSLDAGPATRSAPSYRSSLDAGAAPPRVTRLSAASATAQKPLTLPSRQPAFPMLALIVSGNHSQLVLFRDHGDYDLLGQTQDDAVGEAFDKVAKILGLPYPGGPSVERAAKEGDARAYDLPKARMQNPYDFSFSGLKTAVLRAVQREVGKDFKFPSHELSGLLNDKQRNDFAASFCRVAVETLVDKTVKAYEDYSPTSVVIAGGVAASPPLREELTKRLPIEIEYAPMSLCTDNAAMIATLGYYHAQKRPADDPYTMEVVPSISMTKTKWASA